MLYRLRTLHASSLGTTSFMLAVVLFSACHANVSAASPVIIPMGQTQTTILKGQYGVFSFSPEFSPMAIPLDGYYEILDEAWLVRGNISGGTMDIAVINDSNYQAFVNGSQPLLPVQQMRNASESFNVTVTFPKDNIAEAFAWWMVFDNRAGASNVTVDIGYNGNTFSTSFVWTGSPPEFILMGAVLVVAGLLVAGAAWRKKRRGRISEIPETRLIPKSSGRSSG